MAVELFLKTHDVNILRATCINFKLSEMCMVSCSVFVEIVPIKVSVWR